MFELVLHIGTDEQCEINFTVSPAYLAAAIASGSVNAADPLDRQIRCAAIRKAAELGGCGDDDAWALVEGEQTIVMNESALQFVQSFLA